MVWVERRAGARRNRQRPSTRLSLIWGHSSLISDHRDRGQSYLGSCEQGAGGRGVLSQSLTVRTQSLSAWGVSVWDECLLAWPHSPGLRVWARAGHWLVTGPASDRPAAHCQGRASQIQTGQICSGGNCWLQCWLSLAGSGVRIPNYNWRCLCVSRINQTTSAISWFSFWMSIKYNAPWFLWSMLNVLNVFDWKLPSENIRITYFPVFVNISNGSGAWLQCVERV